MKKILSEICVNVENTNDRFVGLRYNKGDIKIIFPLGYQIPSTDKEKINAIKDLFRTIKIAHENKLEYEEIGDYEDKSDGLPIDSYQWIINDYLDNGIYIDNERTYSQKSKGKINWKRTFKTRFLVNNNSLVYLDPVYEKNSNILNILSEIHAYCVDKSSELLWFLYNNVTKIGNVKKPNIKYYISIVNDEISKSFDDRKKLLLYHIKRVLLSEVNSNDRNSIREYGVKKYEYVWEHMINDLYGTEDVKKFYPDATYHIKLSKKTLDFNASKLRPDTIFKYENDFYIIDSKYYKASCVANGEYDLKNVLPNTDSIQKQITYGDFILKNFKDKEEIKDIYNAFIIPYNKFNNKLGLNNIIEKIGYATCNWKDLNSIDEKYLKIQIILVDTKYVIDSYLNKNIERDLLINKIKEDN